MIHGNPGWSSSLDIHVSHQMPTPLSTRRQFINTVFTLLVCIADILDFDEARPISGFKLRTGKFYQHSLKWNCGVPPEQIVISLYFSRAKLPSIRRMRKQSSAVKLCTWKIVHSEVQTSKWSNDKQNTIFREKGDFKNHLLSVGHFNWCAAHKICHWRKDENMKLLDGSQITDW